MRALLDVNVLIALFDASHESHLRCQQWLENHIEAGWASCAITQNGLVRILSQPAYPGHVSVSEALSRLRRAIATQHHQFFNCALSLGDTGVFNSHHIIGHRQITDAYLLAVAVKNNARLVTLDRHIVVGCVRNAGDEHLTVIG